MGYTYINIMVLLVITSIKHTETVTNAALGKPASMSTYRQAYPPFRAVDGDYSTFIHTEDTVDLIDVFKVYSVTVTTRNEDAYPNDRFRNFTIGLSSDHLTSGPSTTLCHYHPGIFNRAETKELNCSVPTLARRVRVTMVWSRSIEPRPLDISEVEVKALPVCGTFGFTLTNEVKRSGEILDDLQVNSSLDCSVRCHENVLCDAYQVMTSASGAVMCQLFTGRQGTMESNAAWKHYHFSG